MDDILKIALGVFIGALAAAFTWEGIQAVRLEIAMRQANAEMQKTMRVQDEAQRRREQAQTESQQRQEREAQERTEQQQEAMRLNRQRQQDKEEAFKQFYKPTESCKADPIQTECANAHIKAKTVFESRYVPAR